jgi:hypothetical protein
MSYNKIISQIKRLAQNYLSLSWKSKLVLTTIISLCFVGIYLDPIIRSLFGFIAFISLGIAFVIWLGDDKPSVWRLTCQILLTIAVIEDVALHGRESLIVRVVIGMLTRGPAPGCSGPAPRPECSD